MLPEIDSDSPLQEDEVIREIRRYREAHAASFDYDIMRMVEDIKSRESDSGHKLVKRSHRPPVTASEEAA